MPQQLLQCPYCTTMNPLPVVIASKRDKVWLFKLYESEESSTIETLSYEVKCLFCNNEYTFIKMEDYSWFVRKLEPSDTLLRSLKTNFPDTSLGDLSQNVVGIVRPKGSIRHLFGSIHVHICFNTEGARAYIDCSYRKGKLRGLDVFEV